MLKVQDHETGFIYTVYDSILTEKGILFLVFFDGRGWRYMKADIFVPYEEEGKWRN